MAFSRLADPIELTPILVPTLTRLRIPSRKPFETYDKLPTEPDGIGIEPVGPLGSLGVVVEAVEVSEPFSPA